MKINTLLALALALPFSASGFEANWSGFGTLGYAVSDQPYKYQRFIDDQGTFKRDSVLGVQMDAKLSPQWGATVQARLAPASDSDKQWEPSLAWAFVSWRPADDLLIRAGKLRLPFMINTENQEVGATYPFARLPVEVYSTAPSSDIVGLMVSKSWWMSTLEWGVDGYYGKINYPQRVHGRDMSPQGMVGGTWFEPIQLQGGGLVFSLRSDDDLYRLGLHRMETRMRHGGRIVTEPAFYPLPSPPYQAGEGLYNQLASPMVDNTVSPLLTFGASIGLPAGFQLSTEYARVRVINANNGWDRWAAYGALSKRIGAWTPYGYYARMKAGGRVLRLYQSIENNRVSLPMPGMNESQRFAADMLIASDQSTWALGSSYQLSPRSLLKAEWSQTKTGVVSSFVDAPSGSSSADQRINVLSLSYSFTF